MRNDIITTTLYDQVEEENRIHTFKNFMCMNVGLENNENVVNSSESDFIKSNLQGLNLNAAPSTISSETCSMFKYEMRLSRLGDMRQPDIQFGEDSKFLFKIVLIENVSEFFICPEKANSDEYRQLELTLSQFYNQHVVEIKKKFKRNDFLKHGLLCVAQSQNTGFFYRASIKHIIQGQSDNEAKICVNYIDHGSSEVLDPSKIFPIFSNFFSLPPFCLLSKLDFVEPMKFDSQCDERLDYGWSKEAINALNNLLVPGVIYEAKISQKSQPIELNLDKPLELLIYSKQNNFTKQTVSESVNQEMVRLGYAIFSNLSYQKSFLHTDANPDQLDSVSVKKANNEIDYDNLVSKKSSETYCLLPAEDEDFKKKRMLEYIEYQSKFGNFLI